MNIPITKNQRNAALLADVELIPSVKVGGKHPRYHLSWDREVTGPLLLAIRTRTPEHASRAIPYNTLRAKIVIEYRNSHASPEFAHANQAD